MKLQPSTAQGLVGNVRRLSLAGQWPLVLAGWMAMAAPVDAAEPPAAPPTAQAALETLLNSPVGLPSGAVAGTPAGRPALAAAVAVEPAGAGRVTVTVNRGQGLDQILRQHLAASPLRVEVLRELARQLNPHAFAPGAGHRLLAGARLQLPSAEDQVQHAFGRVIAPRETPAASDAPVGGGAAAAARKGWVRYP